MVRPEQLVYQGREGLVPARRVSELSGGGLVGVPSCGVTEGSPPCSVGGRTRMSWLAANARPCQRITGYLEVVRGHCT